MIKKLMLFEEIKIGARSVVLQLRCLWHEKHAYIQTVG